MARHVPEGGLTWYKGSILPYASLWHTLLRLGSLNRLTLSEIPDQPAIFKGLRAYRNSWDPLFNKLNQIDTDQLLISLGESPNSMRWSHLGNISPWMHQYFNNHLRFCRVCLIQGYHTSLFSLKLLERCPIHGKLLFDRCSCGNIIGGEISSKLFRNYERCVCGCRIYIDPDCCRSSKITVEQTRSFDDIVLWLEDLTSIIKPPNNRPNSLSSIVNSTNVDIGTWCDAFKINYPLKLAKQELEHHSLCSTSGGPFLGKGENAKEIFNPPLKKYWWNGSPATWTYRSISRYLRRHCVIEDKRIGRNNSMPYDPAAELKILIQDPKFAAAYTEAAWAEHLEHNVRQRRWPYRDPLANSSTKFVGQLEIFGAPQWSTNIKIDSRIETWLEYHWAAYCMLCVWVFYKNVTDRLVAGGSRWDETERIKRPEWDWAAKIQPNGSAVFVCLKGSTSVLPMRRGKSKNTRVYEHKLRELRKAETVINTCKGPCLTWNHRDGWLVGGAISPDEVSCKRHTLLGPFSGKPKFWLYTANDRYIARLEAVALQVDEQSPSEAISNLRTAYAQYIKKFSLEAQKIGQGAKHFQS